ncbi:hypothetical protein WR25_17138 [Diploscapter pachys]|uniref:Shavenoid isoform B-like N-terminal domain-containing protein n=1 Tax=Diploscapter pachys TaxID=2018661 RepID=A0A2A2JGU0_9BILA|nr:hypothetical protein WR25_17138 [Diploscapter pachys]
MHFPTSTPVSSSLIISIIASIASASPAFFVKSIVSSVVREPNKPDQIVSALCPAECHTLFGALTNNSTLITCSCICPKDAPIFHNSISRCVPNIDECRSTVLQWNNSVPVFNLPPKHGIVNLLSPLVSQQNVDTTRGCRIRTTQFENARHRLAEMSNNLFHIESLFSKAYIIFDGNQEDASKIAGFCVIWQICQNLKRRKRKILSMMQARVLKVQKEQQNYRIEPALGDFEIIYDNADEEWPIRDANGNYLPQPKRAVAVPARAYFTDLIDGAAEEEEEQLVYLRRMIGVAKMRIRMKRFSPTLSSIIEEAGEDKPDENKWDHAKIIETKIVDRPSLPVNSIKFIQPNEMSNSDDSPRLNRVKQLINDFEQLDQVNDNASHSHPSAILSPSTPPLNRSIPPAPQRFKSMIPTPIAQRSPHISRAALASSESRQLGSAPNAPSMRANRMRRWSV